MQLTKILLVSALMTGCACEAQAAVSAADAQKLGTTLTKFGSDPAASSDGAIPAYTGGILKEPNLPTSADAGYQDPFASEKPLFSVTAANMGQYGDQLTPGTQALMKRYPDFRVDVYPTHRTAVYPEWVLANTVKNATRAQMIGDGDGVSGAYGGIPFPIPKTGYEVMWNSSLQYRPAYCIINQQSYLMDSNGNLSSVGHDQNEWITPYYDPSATVLNGRFWGLFTVKYTYPVTINGTQYLFQYPINFQDSDDVTWTYTPGTRRVRLAPEFKYDTPIAPSSGASNYDEVQLFYGRMNKFDFKLVGKKEMIVPYNDYKMGNSTEAKVFGPHVINPDGIRWERHRVWVVDATLKPGERHVFSRWTFFIDEDSWLILATDSYDQSHAMYRVGFTYPYQNYTQGDATSYADPYTLYDLSRNYYATFIANTAGRSFYSCKTALPNMSNYTAHSMGSSAIR